MSACSHGSSSVLPPALEAALGAPLHAAENLAPDSPVQGLAAWPTTSPAGASAAVRQSEVDWRPFQGAYLPPQSAAPFTFVVRKR